MHILEAALFSNLSAQRKRTVEEIDRPGSIPGTTARPLAALVVLVALFSALELASPARPAELAAQAETATMTISGLASVSGDLSKSP